MASVSEYSADGARITVTPYGILLELTSLYPDKENHPHAVPVVSVRLPLLSAKEIALVLRARLKEMERAVGPIAMTTEQFRSLGIGPEDW